MKKTVVVKGKKFSKYQISKGRIFSLVSGRELKQFDDQRGYLCVDLMDDDNVSCRVKVHMASAHTFLGPQPEKTIIQHNDGNKHNNDEKNLSYITQQQNVAHAQVVIRGLPYLSTKQQSEIRDMISKEYTMVDIADKLGIKYHVIRDLKNGKTYR